MTKEIAAVCPSCPGGGTTSDDFDYTSNPRTPTPGYNVWAQKTVQTLPDGSKIIVYCNYAGLPMLKVTIDPAGTSQWIEFYRYNTDGLLIWIASPSAVSGYDDTYDDLLNYNPMTGLYQYLNNSTGLIQVFDYYTSTGSGAVLDYLQNENVREGQSGTDILLRSHTYTSNIDSAGNAVYPEATIVEYPDASNPAITITTSFAYTFVTGTNIISQITTTLPVVSTAQNWSNTADTKVEDFDAYGNTSQTTDERAIVNKYTRAGAILGAVTQQVLNYQSGITAPGVNVTSDMTYDNRGEPKLTLGPSHTVVLSGTATTVRKLTSHLVVQSVKPTSGKWAPDQDRTAKGYATGTGPSYTYVLVNPVTLMNSDKDGRVLDRITSKRTTGSGALSPTDTFDQTDWQTWASAQFDNQHRAISGRFYFLIPSSGVGKASRNFGQTTNGYDALERKNRVVAPDGTITRTVFTTPQRVASVWIGTNDTGATDADPAGGGAAGNNMVIVTANEYDGGSAGGDGNPTQETAYASATDTRVTNRDFDFRNRPIGTLDPIGRYFLDTFDNLDRRTQSQGYSSLGGTLFSQRQIKHDDRSRVYQTLMFAVNVSTGVVGNALVGNNWFDPSSNLMQAIAEGDGKVFTKNVFNGVNWVTSSYRGYNPSGVSYSQANTVAGDIIVEQTDSTFDEAGNVVNAAMSQRLNDAPASGTGSTGALSYGSDPKARVSFTASWFDGIDRTIASANYGAIASFTRPSTPPSSSATVLVNLTGYDDAGRPYQTTDPKGIVNEKNFDNANRTATTIEDVGGLARTTNFTWTLDNLPASMTAVNSATGDQTTWWIYGTTLADSGVARNDLLRCTAYPGASLSWSTLTSNAWASLTADQWANLPVAPDDQHITQNTFNRLGEQNSFTDQRATKRTFVRDDLGRLTDDCVTTVGTDTDSAVLRISREYEVRGLVSLITSADDATPGSGTILNQVKLLYNDFAQLIGDEQEHAGAVGGSTPSVRYAFDDGGSDSNEIRFNELTYPNARTIAPSYGTSGGMNDHLNRVDAIQDTTSGTTTLAGYIYLGAGTVIRITYPEPGIWLDLWGGTSGTFAGLDLFNRVIDQRWQNDITGTPTDIDRFKYGHDRNSNRIWKANVVGTAAVAAGLDEFYDNDALNRLTNMQRGVLNGTQSGITGTPSVEQDWTLDATGNWSNFVTKAAGTTDLNQTRTANTVNEIINITESTGPTWIVPAYDDAGNTITMPQVFDPTLSFTAVYDAWNRLVSISAGGTPVGQYQYDGRDFRIVKKTYTSGTLSETRDFYFTSNWQDIEEQVSGSMVDQYVWGIRYIDELVCRDDPTNGRLYAAQDANFNFTNISDVGGTIVERYLLDPYGNQTVMSAAWAVVGSSSYHWVFGFQGRTVDAESELIHERRRYLLSVIGAFCGRDLLQYVDGLNLYQFVRGNPVNRVDIEGTASVPTAQPGAPVTGGNTPPNFALNGPAGQQLALLQKICDKYAKSDPDWGPGNQCAEQASRGQGVLGTDPAWAATTPKLWAIGTVGGVNTTATGSHNVILLTPVNGNALPPMILDSFHGPQRAGPRGCTRETLFNFKQHYPQPEDTPSWWEAWWDSLFQESTTNLSGLRRTPNSP